MSIKVHFTGFWSGFHERTNPVHEGFFLTLFEEVYGCAVQTGSFEESTILIENTQVEHSRRTEKQWRHTYVYSGESYLRGDASSYTCVLYGQRNHDNYVNVPLYLPYIICSHNQSFIELNMAQSITTVPPKQVVTVISNSSGTYRNQFCELLEQNGISVTYAGHYKNTIGGALQASYNTPEFQEYIKQFKFIISMENSEEDTYITEKITHGLFAQTIPVYWGSKQVTNYFNPDRFIEVTDRDSAIQTIKTMTDAEWLRMINQRPFTEFGQHYTISEVARHIRNVVMPSPFPLLNQVFIICNPQFEPIRYEQCRNMYKSLGLFDHSVTFICPTYKHTITPELASRYIKNDLVKRLRSTGTKRGELSLTLNWRAVLETIIKQYKGGMFLILESDAYLLPEITDLNKCLKHLSTKQWDAINIGSGLDKESDPLKRLPHIECSTPYRERPATELFYSQPSEDISSSGDPNRFIRKFMTRCTDAQIFSYEGCKKLADHMRTDENYGAPFDYYLINKTEQDMTFKYYWSTIAYFDQRSNRGLDASTLQRDLS